MAAHLTLRRKPSNVLRAYRKYLTGFGNLRMFLALCGRTRASASQSTIAWRTTKMRRFNASKTALEAVPGVADMEIFRGNKILEIRAKSEVNKGYALSRLIRDWNLKSVLALGDDTTDADAPPHSPTAQGRGSGRWACHCGHSERHTRIRAGQRRLQPQRGTGSRCLLEPLGRRDEMTLPSFRIALSYPHSFYAVSAVPR